MYTPKIHHSLIPCIYHAAQERKVPMTKLTDAFVFNGLNAEHFGTEVLSRLPAEQDIIHPQLKVQWNAHEINQSDPASFLPFSSVNQLNAWYQSAHFGLMQAYALKDPSERSKRQAEIATKHLQAAYIAASDQIKQATPNEVIAGARLFA